jgi:hypothetical protein
MNNITFKNKTEFLPDGKYHGVLSGYIINIQHNDVEIECDCTNGIRGISQVEVYIQNGKVIME